MRVFTELDKVHSFFPKTSIALGNFDGLHIGHQSVIMRAVRLARQKGVASAVFTFSNHPISLIDPKRSPPLLLTAQDKIRLLRSIGVDALILIPFTPEILQLSPEKFVQLLINTLHPVHIEVGPNYSFGHRGRGNPEMLREAGEQYGFSVEIHPAVYIEDVLVSSTVIRRLIQQGKVEKAAAYLGRPFRLKGRVVSGDGRGRNLGYPTANLSIEEGLISPGDGVYAVEILTRHGIYQGVANVGENPTFKGQHRRIEVFIFDFSADLYGCIISVLFLKQIRKEITFSSASELQTQIAHDIIKAKDFFSAR
ncbi:MAG: riboflavin biosynthesis protein RibF [Firmicutes bacterium]|nr:riboflavin biosynthesis protein RibF [Bacillota bacterium]